MPDLFISYSRKDKDFVRRLDESLKSRGREAWVDWEDIRPTEDFMQAIYGAIEGVDTFVFVLTPDSVASVVAWQTITRSSLPLFASKTFSVLIEIGHSSPDPLLVWTSASTPSQPSFLDLTGFPLAPWNVSRIALPAAS